MATDYTPADCEQRSCLYRNEFHFGCEQQQGSAVLSGNEKAIPPSPGESKPTTSARSPSRPRLFVGERRSLRAVAMKVSWLNGRLSAKTLHNALAAVGLDPAEQLYVNLYVDPPAAPNIDREALATITRHSVTGGVVIALGRRVSKDLNRHDIPHVMLVHPAARGSIRRTANYRAHVASVLAVSRQSVLALNADPTPRRSPGNDF